MKNIIQQFLKFGVVGVIAFFIDSGIMMLLHNVCGMPIIPANVISFSVSVIFNYIASMKYVFEGRNDISKTREFVIFIILSVIGLIINTFIMWIIVDVAFSKMNNATALYNILCLGAKIFATAIVTVYNFVTRKIFLENKEA